MISPLLFWSWKDAEHVYMEGKHIMVELHQLPAQSSTSIWARMEHGLCVLLVWLLGARLPRYMMNVALLGIAILLGIRPSLELFLLAVVVLLPWALILALGSVLDVTLMLRLRKQRPRYESTTDKRISRMYVTPSAGVGVELRQTSNTTIVY